MSGAFRPDDIPVPADLERHYVEPPLRELFDNFDEGLFNLRFLKLSRTDEAKTRETAALVAGLKEEIISKGLFKARGVYRFFPASADGDAIKFMDSSGAELARAVFPRQKGGERLCLADFVAAGGGPRDYVGLFAATCGEGVAGLSRREKEAGNYVRSYLIEALALSLAEAFADVMHYKMRQAWAIAEPQPARPLLRSRHRGRRYSFGYSVCPDLSGQKVLFDLLEPGPDAGITLTDGFMMDPEASVSALVLHNPKAVYFDIGDAAQ